MTVVVSALILGSSFGAQVALSVFIQPIGAEMGWARGQISLAYSLATFSAGLSGIGMGYLADRFSFRPMLLLGSALMGLAHVLLGLSGQLWHFYLLYGLLVGGLCQGAFLTPLLANVGFWFDRNKGVALGCTLAGQSLGAALVPLVARELIGGIGWRHAYLALGIGYWLLLPPLAWLVRQPPGLKAARAASLGGLATRHGQAALRPGVLTGALGAAIICCCICMSIPVLHVVSLASDAGIDAGSAASVLTVLMAVSMVGRLGIGKLADAIGGVRALLAASATQTALIFWFTRVHSLGGFYLIAALFALGYGGVIPAYAIIIRELVPARRVGASMGLVMFCGNIGMGLGGYLGGALFDWSGGYTLPYGTGAVAGMVNLVIVGSLLLVLRGRQPALSPLRAASG